MPDREGSKLGAVAPHHAAGQPQEGQPDSSTWPREGSASPVASPTSRGPDGPRAPPKKSATAKRKTPPAGLVRRAGAIKTAPEGKAGSARAKPRSGSENRQRVHVARIRLDDAEMEKLEELASASGLTIGAYFRAAALKTAGVRARPRPPVDRELLARTSADLYRVGNNINQIAHALHIGLDAPHSVAEAMGDLRGTLSVIRRAAGYPDRGDDREG